MSNRILIVALLMAASLLAVGNTVGIMVSLFWRWRWFDMPMHFMGGVVVALAALSVFRIVWGRAPRVEWAVCMGAALSVGVAWEAWEVLQQLMFLDAPRYWPDTLGDIFFDMLGGAVVWGTVRFVESRSS